MAQQQRIVVRGYRELLRSLKDADKDTRRNVRQAFREAGELVRADAAERLSKYGGRTAGALRVRVRQNGVAVDDPLPKVTGKRPDWGAKVFRELYDSRARQYGRITRTVESALDRVADEFN